MLSESLLAAVHTERLRRRVPWPLFAAMLRRIAGVRLPVMLETARVPALLLEIERTRLPARERSRDLPSWRSVATLHAAAERAFGFEPVDTDRWLQREGFGATAQQLDVRALAQAIARLRGVSRAAPPFRSPTHHGATSGC